MSFPLWAVFLLLTGDWTKPSKRVLALPKAAKCCRGTRAAVKQLWTCISFSSSAARMFYKLLPSKEIYIWCKENYFGLRLAIYLFHELKYTQRPAKLLSFVLNFEVTDSMQCFAEGPQACSPCFNTRKNGEVKQLACKPSRWPHQGYPHPCGFSGVWDSLASYKRHLNRGEALL